MCFWFKDTRAQSSVEMAFVLPVLLVTMLLLLEPALVLIDRIALEAAATEVGRLLVSAPETFDKKLIEHVVERRLSFLPHEEHFCCEQQGKRAQVAVEGCDTAREVSVTLTLKLRPLPLIDTLLRVFPAKDYQGFITLTAHYSAPTQPRWISEGVGLDPHTWEKEFARD